jgi:APA family basic amino acid/polyamine antiporter
VTQLSKTALVRAIGRWSLAALMVNTIVGSGVFGLPGVVAGLLGPMSPWAVLLAGAAVGVIMACFAEVASQFTQAGGPYLYARITFGRLVGIEVGWMLLLTRLAAPAANADLFVTYLGEFWPQATAPLPRLLILTALIGILMMVNVRGVRGGTRISNILTVAKLAPLFLVAGAGLVYLIAGHKISPEPAAVAGPDVWLKAVLMLVFAYGGFESGLAPASEAKDPRRDNAFALFVALVICTLLYTTIQWVVVGVLPDPAHSPRPLADVARLALGRGGAALIAVGAMVSVYGNLSANVLTVPRITFALAERGDFPSVFAAVHPKFRTPYFSILAFAFFTWLLALLGSFAWNVTLTAVGRLVFYSLGCAALPILRRRQPGATLFRVPGGPFFAVLGVAICLALITQVNLSGSLILLTIVVAAFLNWLLVRNRAVPETPVP